MLKEWLWWQIEVSMEHLEDDNITPLSDLTICYWMALVLQGVQVSSVPTIHYGGHMGEISGPDWLLYGSA
ncbi:MAG: hypothetical protein CVU57_24970 [Deltaproteobacteria bacterium HGW-Deltaproteobacteria-15]|jgi:hypothetical protein|nr:MAG: hypothetical protein CVU57_24970 [Deltaproteobacteria bacterium HGW-Deltaproteobacteria-15]